MCWKIGVWLHNRQILLHRSFTARKTFTHFNILIDSANTSRKIFMLESFMMAVGFSSIGSERSLHEKKKCIIKHEKEMFNV